MKAIPGGAAGTGDTTLCSPAYNRMGLCELLGVQWGPPTPAHLQQKQMTKADSVATLPAARQTTNPRLKITEGWGRVGGGGGGGGKEGKYQACLPSPSTTLAVCSKLCEAAARAWSSANRNGMSSGTAGMQHQPTS